MDEGLVGLGLLRPPAETVASISTGSICFLNLNSQGIITDPRLHDNPIIFANPGLEAITGYQSAEVLGRNCRFLQGPETDPSATAELRHAVAAGIPCTVELLNYRKDGAMFWNAVTLLPVYDGAEQLTHIVGVQIDVTERKRLEARLRQSEKMEAIGQLAGGVAHDFNNMLAVINGCSASLSQSDRLNKSELEAVADLRAAGERAARLTRQLLAFSRQQVLKPTIVNLNEVVVETERMLSRVIGEDIRILPTLEPTLWPIRIDPGQFEQILLHLAINARDAMPRGGVLTIATRPCGRRRQKAPREARSRQSRVDTREISESFGGSRVAFRLPLTVRLPAPVF